MMADGHERPNNIQEKSFNSHDKEDSDLEDQNHPMVLDLGDDFSRLNDSNRLGFPSAEASGNHF